MTEHEKLSIENPLLKQQIQSLEELNKLYIKADSLQKVEVKTYQDKVTSDEKRIKELKSTRTTLSIGCIVLFILGLLI